MTTYEPLSLYQSESPERLRFFSEASCGWPSPAQDHETAPLSLDELVSVSACSTFFVRARGESMINAGIHDGDVLVVHRNATAKDGDVVIAVVDSEFLVKRLGRVDGQPALIPDHPTMEPIVFSDGEEVVIWGKVTWVLHVL